jgi:hypothetical protein
MGIAAEDYIRRRCNVSLGLPKPEELKVEDLERLVESVGMTAEVYMGTEKVQRFKEEILALKKKTY